MSAASFVATVCPYAKQAAQNTGLDPRLMVVQWAVETGLGTSNLYAHHNLAGITCPGGCPGGSCLDGRFCQYPSLAVCLNDYLHFLHNGLYPGVLASAGQPLTAQMIALGQSPWDAGHYNSGGGPGSSLIAMYHSYQATFDACTSGGGGGGQCPTGYHACGTGACCPDVTTPPPGGGGGGGEMFGALLLLSGAGSLGYAWWRREQRHHPHHHGAASAVRYAAPRRSFGGQTRRRPS